jgi:ankyrin repeat protein
MPKDASTFMSGAPTGALTREEGHALVVDLLKVERRAQAKQVYVRLGGSDEAFLAFEHTHWPLMPTRVATAAAEVKRESKEIYVDEKESKQDYVAHKFSIESKALVPEFKRSPPATISSHAPSREEKKRNKSVLVKPSSESKLAVSAPFQTKHKVKAITRPQKKALSIPFKTADFNLTRLLNLTKAAWRQVIGALLDNPELLVKTPLADGLVQLKLQPDTPAYKIEELNTLIIWQKKLGEKNTFGTLLSPMQWAAKRGLGVIIKALLALGANLDKLHGGRAAVHFAAEMGHHTTLELFNQLGADLNIRATLGFTAAFYAAQNGHDKALEVLGNSGANMNISEDSEGFTPAIMAASNGHEKALEVLGRFGANVNTPDKEGYTPAYASAYRGHEKALEVLGHLGADMNTPNKEGHTPAISAAQKGYDKILVVLKRFGASMNTPDNKGLTPVCTATLNGHHKVLEVLIRLGANINISTDTGATPSSIAAQRGDVKAIKLLIAAHANLHTPTRVTKKYCDEFGMNESPEIRARIATFIARHKEKDYITITPLETAQIFGNAEVAELLEHAIKSELMTTARIHPGVELRSSIRASNTASFFAVSESPMKETPTKFAHTR